MNIPAGYRAAIAGELVPRGALWYLEHDGRFIPTVRAGMLVDERRQPKYAFPDDGKEVRPLHEDFGG